MWELEVGGRHGSLPFSLLFFLRVVFVLKFLLFERGQVGVVGITKSLVLWLGLSSSLPCLPLPSERENTEKQAPPRHLILSYGRCRRVRANPVSRKPVFCIPFETRSSAVTMGSLIDPGAG